jgi:hypothetical protein
LFSADGSFRIDDVPPGTYTLRIVLTEPFGTYSPLSRGTPIGSLETEVTMPESADRTPFDLGILSMTPAAARMNHSSAR